MSSIYQKSRDNYYYYQAYVYNPETGKKNKKIFHSLKTKDLEVAKIKKLEYDELYSSDNVSKKINQPFEDQNWLTFFKKSLIVLSIFLIIIIIYFYTINQSESSEIKIVDKSSAYSSGLVSDLILEKNLTNTSIDDNKESIFVDRSASKIKVKLDNDNKVTKSVEGHLEIDIPQFKVQRIEKLSGAFKQGKLHIIIKSQYETLSLRNLCRSLKGEYSEYSNLIICLYSNDEIGFSLSNGIKDNFSSEQIKKAWIGMYSYNPVEGEYFDENPTRYLGGF